MRQKSSSGKWRSHQNVASGGKGSKGSGGKELMLSGEASSDFAAGQVYEFVSTTPVTCDVTSMFHLRQSIASCSAKSRHAFYQYFMLNYLYKRTNTS